MTKGYENRIVPVTAWSSTAAFSVFWAVVFRLVICDAVTVKHYDVLVYGANAAGVSWSIENRDFLYAPSG